MWIGLKNQGQQPQKDIMKAKEDEVWVCEDMDDTNTDYLGDNSEHFRRRGGNSFIKTGPKRNSTLLLRRMCHISPGDWKALRWLCMD